MTHGDGDGRTTGYGYGRGSKVEGVTCCAQRLLRCQFLELDVSVDLTKMPCLSPRPAPHWESAGRWGGKAGRPRPRRVPSAHSPERM
jgi:hypothetical protein